MKTKAISPLIATVLLIAFTITIANIIAVFYTGFLNSQQTSSSEKSKTTLNCAWSALKINSAAYNGTSGALRMRVTNEDKSTNDFALTNITFSVIKQDSSAVYPATCNCADESLLPGDTKFYSAQVAGGCNITSIYVSANCQNAKDSITSSGIDFTNC